MSYNIMNKRASFQGTISGSIEDMVDIHTTQTISGQKTFTDLSASTVYVANDLTASGIISASVFYGDGTGLSGVTATPDGSNTEVQFNADNAFGASSNFTFNTGSNALTVTGDITASVNISASAFFGDGAGLTNVTTDVSASDLIGTLSASQIDYASPLTNSAGNLTLKFASANSGLTDSSGIKLDFGGLGATPYVDTYNVAAEDTSGNHFKITLGTIGNNIETNATNITAGTLNNARLPSNINVTSVSASTGLSASTGQFGEITSNLVPETTNTFYLGAPDLSKRWASVNSVNSNVSGLAVVATGAVSHRLGIGTLNPSSELEVTGNIAVSGNIELVGGSFFFDADGTGTGTGPKLTAGGTPANSLNIDGDDIIVLQSDSNIKFRVGTPSTPDLHLDITTTEIQAYLPISSSQYVSASAYAMAGGTVIDSAANFQGNNASFNEITALSVISSSAEISASSFHGDGSALTGIAQASRTFYYLRVNAQLNSDPASFPWFLLDGSGQANPPNQLTRFIAPASGSVERVLYTPSIEGSAGEGFETGDTPIFFFRKNDVSNNINNLTMHTTASTLIPFSYDNDTGTVNTNRVVFDTIGGNPVVTGSTNFDPGDILIFGGYNPQDTLDEIGITIVLSFDES